MTYTSTKKISENSFESFAQPKSAKKEQNYMQQIQSESNDSPIRFTD